MDRKLYLEIMDKHPHIKKNMTQILGSTTYSIIYRDRMGGIYEADLYNNDPFRLPNDPNNLSEDEYKLIFAHRVRTVMKAKRVLCKVLANDVGISNSCLNGYLNAKVMPSLHYTAKISMVLKVPLDDFVYKWNGAK